MKLVIAIPVYNRGKKLSPLVEVSPDNVLFSWSISSDKKNGKLSYELCIGFKSSKLDLNKLENCPGIKLVSFQSSNIKNERY
jgi:hypothetical protein